MPSAPKGPQKPPEIKVGDVVLERYRVVEQIGSGGHSVVFKGQDERLSRPVCIKVFSGLGGESGVGRTSYEHFVQEAFALSRLTHPNTLRIYDFGHLGPKDSAGMPLQVCEYMNGGTLSNIIREQGKQSLYETVRVTSAMCAALAEAHGLGIVHRDIKPQNILFGSVGLTKLPKLADFGIAKWSADNEDSGQRAEDTAIVAGQKLAMYSPSWAAPEQLAGQPVSPMTDIYSLACVAVYMLSGRAIFADEDVYAGYKKRRHADEHVKDALQPLNIPKQVIAILSHALAFDPKKRIAKVEDLSAELQATTEPSTTEDQPRLPPPPAVPGRSTKPLDLVTPTTPVGAVTPPHASPVVPQQGTQTTSTKPMPTAVAPPEPAAPVLAAADLTPATYHAPPGVAPWMQGAAGPGAGGPARRLALIDAPQPVADRRGHFVMMTGSNSADLVGQHGAKVRVTLLPGPTGQRVVHLKGLTCFVAHLGGRPSPAVTLDRTSDVALVTPRAQEIGHLRVAQGTAAPGQTTFTVGNDHVAIASDDCGDPILFDFGPGSDVYFVYTRGRTVPKSGRRG
ncbi:MAG: serine/threonine protein kinase [Deltaproteobacteria bacterium]|nr:serine/threonine protein kinase [Deltaproteobacteria bacterium]